MIAKTPFEKLIIVDLESTCWKKDPPPDEQSEIIEVGLCVLDCTTLTPQHKRSLLVKPTRSKVSDFCTRLTSLTQSQVDAGMTFAAACDVLRDEYHVGDYVWASWGGYDQRMFRAQCADFGVPYPFSEQHINLKQLYADQRNGGVRCGMARALKQEEITLEGHHHRGDDDAWNTARLMVKVLGELGLQILPPYLEPKSDG